MQRTRKKFSFISALTGDQAIWQRCLKQMLEVDLKEQQILSSLERQDQLALLRLEEVFLLCRKRTCQRWWQGHLTLNLDNLLTLLELCILSRPCVLVGTKMSIITSSQARRMSQLVTTRYTENLSHQSVFKKDKSTMLDTEAATCNRFRVQRLRYATKDTVVTIATCNRTQHRNCDMRQNLK